MTNLHADGAAALYALDALSAEEAEAFEQHLVECQQCRQEIPELRETASALSEASAVEPPEQLRTSLLSQIAVTPQEKPDRAPAATDAEASSDAVLIANTRSRLSGWRRVPYLVAAIAVLVALAGGVWGWHAHRAAVVADQQRELISELVSAPDSVSRVARMTGGGRGVVIVSDRDEKAIFVGSDLPTLGADRVYQLWTINGAARSAGLITSAGRTALVSLPAAALSAAVVAITVEPAGGSPQPTTKPVMEFKLTS